MYILRTIIWLYRRPVLKWNIIKMREYLDTNYKTGTHAGLVNYSEFMLWCVYLESVKMVLINKSKKPRAFKKISKAKIIDKSLLPVWYTHQKSARMSTQIFIDWFKNEFVPSVTKFIKSKGLPIKAFFLPSNVTSIAQPMDQGVLELVKTKYRRELLTIILNDENSDEETYIDRLKKIDIVDVMTMIEKAWSIYIEGELGFIYFFI